jgi:hypothetical protein
MSVMIKTLLYLFGMGDNPMEINIPSDSDSICKDWENVGGDILTAMQKYEREATY